MKPHRVCEHCSKKEILNLGEYVILAANFRRVIVCEAHFWKWRESKITDYGYYHIYDSDYPMEIIREIV